MSHMKQSQCCRNFTKNKEDAYRRTLRNNEKLQHWNARNSSAQMNSLMTPDSCECTCTCLELLPDDVTKSNTKIKWATDKKKIVTHSRYHTKCSQKKPPKPKFKLPTIKRNVVPSICCECGQAPSKSTFKNECYCRDPPNKPFLPVKPAVTQPRRTIKNGYKSLDGEIESTHNLQTLKKAKDLLQGYSPESEFLKRLRKEAKEVYDCHCDACRAKERTADLQFTTHRYLLEEAYKDVEKNKNSVDYCNCEIKSCSYGKSPKISRRTSGRTPSSSAENVISTSPQFSPNTSQNFNDVIDSNEIQNVKQIRDDNYFDTHSTNLDLDKKNIPEHKCVHKFCVDERLLPTPLNADGFGVSRCTICNKPMEYSTRKSEEMKISPGRVSDFTNIQKVTNQKSIRISPRKINIATKNEVMELRVPPILITARNDIKLHKMLVPTNTWALRYQKGVI